MYCMVVGQSIPASILPTIARDNMSSRYVFNCSASHARMAGLDSEVIETFLASLENNVGRCIVKAARLKAFLGAIPQTSVDDLRYVIQQTGYTREGWQTVDADPDQDNMEDLQPKRHLWAVRDEETGEQPGQSDELERGIQAYLDGARTIDEFQAAMGLPTQHQARGLLARVKQAIREGA